LSYFLYKYAKGILKPSKSFQEGEWGKRENNGGDGTKPGYNLCTYGNVQ
jgi:hypothetical protein